ncbi:CvpA family protein [Pseudoxanthomonas daejeonensis]|uniref:Colicin V production protein n=1 Tax=Pseudoxanthomonas daejeonensis TaxID=266062 RepID=A0ABQ6Z5J3_9GAMM|nr:CvpA family protein [Pseudoxanthomonas daejeonensis]KAF1693504.1 colicin V production protein [Pseudoxanthomonas daejeonensis]
MEVIDLVLLAVVAGSALLGVVRGFVGAVASLVAWFGAGWFAFHYGAELAFWFSDNGQPGATELLGAYAVSFIGVLVLVSLVGWGMRKMIHSVGLSGVDRVLGLLLGLLRGVLVACMLVLVMAFSSLPQDPAWIRSQALPVLIPGAQWMARWLPEWTVQELDFGNGRPSGDNALLDRAGAVVETITEALPVPVDENGPPPGAEPPPPPSTPGH